MTSVEEKTKLMCPIPYKTTLWIRSAQASCITKIKMKDYGKLEKYMFFRLLFKCLSRSCKSFFFKKCFKYYTHLDIQLIDFEIYSVCSNFRFSKLHVLRYKDIYFAFFQEKVCVWCTRCGETYATVLGKKAAIVLNKCMSCIQFHANCIHNTRYIYGVRVTWQ